VIIINTSFSKWILSQCSRVESKNERDVISRDARRVLLAK
jgi:hypothetical protein